MARYSVGRPPKEKKKHDFLNPPRILSPNAMLFMYFVWLFVVVTIILVILAIFFPEKYQLPWVNFHGK